MALSYSATIQVRVEAAAALRQTDQLIAKIQKNFGRLERELAKKGPVDAIIEQNDALVEQLDIQKQVQRTNKAAISTADREIRQKARLNAALERQANLQKALTRAGVKEDSDRGRQVREALQAAKVNKQDLGIQTAINAELEKILQTQREINRTDLAQAKVAAKNAVGKSYDQRVKALEQIGVSQDSLLQIERLRSKLSDQNARKQTDLAKKTTFELEQQLKALEALNAEALKLAQTGGGSSAGTGTGTGKDKKGNKFGNILQGAVLGGGFPLLFGGPSFSAAGGLLGGGIGGAIGTSGKFGFAGGIAGSVIGSIFDGLIGAAVEVGKALEDPIKNLNKLVELLPISGTETKGLIRGLQDLGLDAAASAVAVETLNDELGDFGVKDIEKFKDQIDTFDNAVKKLKIAAAGFASSRLLGFIEFLTNSINLFNRAQGKGGGGMLSRAASFAIAQGEMGDEGQSLGQKPPQSLNNEKTSLTENQIKLAERAEQIRQAQIIIAGMEFSIEQDRLNLIRGDLGIRQSQLKVARARLEFEKADLNFTSAQTEADKKRLGLKRSLAEAGLIEARAAEANAVVLARQAQAAFELERASKNQAIVLADLNAQMASQQAVRATSPFANEQFLADPLFGGSRKLEEEQNIRFAETLKVMNKELELVNKNIEFGTNLDYEAKLALVDKKVALENNIARYKEYQPAIDEAALSQARFNEALALAAPVTDLLVDGLVSVVEGTKTAEQAFADLLRGIASMLFDAAKQIIATYIAIGVARLFAGVPAGGGGGGSVSAGAYGDMSVAGPSFFSGGMIPGFANGGRPPVGKPSIVGERGPELFVPNTSGTIVPNHQLGGATNVVVNVDAKGSSSQGNEGQAKQLGQAIGAAVQAELIKQKRPGGLLA